jgi:hypothetical protein
VHLKISHQVKGQSEEVLWKGSQSCAEHRQAENSKSSGSRDVKSYCSSLKGSSSLYKFGKRTEYQEEHFVMKQKNLMNNHS